MPAGRPRKKLELNEKERDYLEKLVRSGNTPQKLAKRAQMLLMSADDVSNTEIAKEVGTTHQTVSHWRNRFFEYGVEGIGDAPRPGAPRTISDEQVAEVIEKTLQSQPEGQTHWSTRSMAKEVGLGRSSISRIWRAFGLKPHRHETFQLSTDPYFIEKVRDVIGLYMNPPVGALVLCIDEKPQIQALERTQAVVPMKPGQIERHTPEYKRRGVTNLFAALEVATGAVVGQCSNRKRALEFREFLDTLSKGFDEGDEVHIVLDNSSIHKTPSIKKWLQMHPNVQFHFTPTHSSWLNLIESWFAKLTRQQLHRGVYHSVQELEAAILAYIEANNDAPVPFIWTRTADQVLERIGHFCKRTLPSQTEG